MKKFYLCALLFFIVFGVGYLSAENIEYEIKSGKYVVELDLTKRSLKNMPIPKTNIDYALLQSIDKSCNIVIGNFASDERRITLIKDSNSDGTVDYVTHWYVDLEQFDVEKKPGKYCPPEKFKQMKNDIFYGKKGTISPNVEGITYMENLLKKSGEVRHWYNGYRVTEYDVDMDKKARVVFFFSDNKNNGADIVVTVNYRYEGIVNAVPTIVYGIYCKNSKDSFVIQMAKEMIAKARANIKK